MRLEDLKDQYPKTPDFISEMIEKEVEKQVHTQKNVRRIRKKKKRRFPTSRPTMNI